MGDVEQVAVDADPPERVLPATRRGGLLVAAVLVLALGLRVGAVYENRDWYEPRTDALHFDYMASALVNGEGFGYAIVPPNTEEQREPTAFRAPLFPMLLGAVYAVFGEHSYGAGRVLNAFLGTTVVAALGVVAAQLWSRRLAIVAMAIAAVHPALIVVGSSLQLEPLLVTLALAAVAAALQHRRRPQGLRWPLVAGVLVGLAVLTRETAAFALLPVAFLVWRADVDRRAAVGRRALRSPILVIAAAVLVVLPWTIRNWVVLDAFVPVSTSSGVGLAGTYNETSMEDPSRPGGWREPWDDPEMLDIMLALDDPSEAEADRVLRDATIDQIREHPDYVLTAVVYNTQRLFDLDGGDFARLNAPALPWSPRLLDLGILGSYVLYVLAILGGWFFRSEHARVPKAIWAIPLTTLPFLVIALPANIRYRYWLEPYLILLATPLVAAAASWVLGRFQRDASVTVAPAAST